MHFVHVCYGVIHLLMVVGLLAIFHIQCIELTSTQGTLQIRLLFNRLEAVIHFFRWGCYQMLEEFIWKALDLLDKLDELGEILTNPDLPDDLGGAQHILEEHNHLKRRVTLAPVEQLSMEGHHILTKITGELPGQSGE